ncbi:hypothetical protein [Alicyclobacillus fastidiosus]|uniref:Uncharacterized protein n=1 Tax=Alicyclobacillus fastidiosus TaxID=392011 RepID=A0ABV5ALS2_9BACL|nr:hypothetical protein [Alicyclobacillus fastidiosus]WEH11056.1 hypothetical protein PYS47_07515 [Alicyclobacillus fastidiosus]
MAAMIVSDGGAGDSLNPYPDLQPTLTWAVSFVLRSALEVSM